MHKQLTKELVSLIIFSIINAYVLKISVEKIHFGLLELLLHFSKIVV